MNDNRLYEPYDEPENGAAEQADLYEHFRIEVDKGQTPTRIDKFLTEKIRNVSRNRIQGAAEAGNILVNGKAVKSSYKVKPLDAISIVLAYPPRETDIKPENIPIDIVYEDEALLVVNKPARMIVHPAHGNFTGTLVNALLYHLRDVPLFRSGEVRPGLVHRIDRNTSGLLVIAKTEMAMNHLARQFYERTTDRLYVALVWGDMGTDSGTVTGHIGRSIRDRKRMQVFPDGEQGKHAVTHWRAIERFGHTTLIECKLETGRTHQIRAHMEYIRHPLFSDEVYGGVKILKGNLTTKYKQFVENCFEVCPRHALHAKTLGFTHPLTNQRLYFDSQLPYDMSALIEKWRKYSTGKGLEE
ncbi:MAG TPA: RluA family pseudouridine synthase [Bacteroidales bacterium]|nr:RluA family pseudouridine synthase [Bacteroidales bacterium]